MKILVPGIIVFLIWCYVSTTWYVCKIKYLCDESVISSAPIAQEEPPTPASSEPLPDDTLSREIKIKESDTGTVIHFAFNSTAPETDAMLQNYLQDFAARNEGKDIQLIGHTDTVGSPDFNYQLGLERAEAVKNMLIAKGFDAEAITLTSKGESEPLPESSSTQDQHSNRRVEIIFQ